MKENVCHPFKETFDDGIKLLLELENELEKHDRIFIGLLIVQDFKAAFPYIFAYLKCNQIRLQKREKRRRAKKG